MEQTTHKRRNFLLALGIGAIGAASVMLTGKRPEIAPQPQAKADEPAPSRGYRVSEHVKRYYRTTRV
jgi:hypothetical protein